ncbi:sulfide:quinone oxidoreductase, mitochondrial isoform X1 [Cimex lectularius]|uniref:Sulfide:quinone oxidoreductase, mitochondrial n=1 Tax=Cimex lectularius TaxID=79782 RepID=A0A8I6S2M5_CIMLE|nr:sulfide:quinone oxidoreductase, mitochondrial isoform X1 [Cimex lectularius]
MIALSFALRSSSILIRPSCRSLTCGGGNRKSCKLLVLGGGTGGCTVASKFACKLGKDKVIIVEPTLEHYYQPMLTLIGGGIKKLDDAKRQMKDVLPKGAIWVNDRVVYIEPGTNTVRTENGTEISYEYLVIALGIDMNFNKIPGLVEGLEENNSQVCSNYSPKYVNKTFKSLQKIKKGQAVFSFPNTPVKCAGAPLKACLISEDYFRKENKRDNIKVIYRTSLPTIFSAKHYASKLLELCEQRDIDVGLKKELVKVKTLSKEAIFRNIERPAETETIKYAMLHVTPPMSAPNVLKTGLKLVDSNGFLNVNKATLQHIEYKNIYGIGDCTNLPTSKTAAAVAAQSGVLFENLLADMKGDKTPKATYDGYTSCPLVTGYQNCIMAEFDYNLQPLETFPIDQRNEHRSMYFMKKDIMPLLYWHAMLKGYWSGPKMVRKILHFGTGK